MTPSKEEMIGKIEKIIWFAENIEFTASTNLGGKAFEAWYNSRKNHIYLGDVLDWLFENKFDCMDVGDMTDIIMDIVDSREEKREPIEDQSTDCIEFLYSLISK